MVDHPDWLQGQVIFSQSQTLDFPANPQVTPNQFVIDTSLFASVDLAIGSAFNPGLQIRLGFEINWLDNGVQVGRDAFTVQPAVQYPADHFATVSIPCRGNQMVIEVVSDTQPFTWLISGAGSSRSIPELQWSGAEPLEPGLISADDGLSIAHGASTTVFYGPLSCDHQIHLECAGATISYQMVVYHMSSGNGIQVQTFRLGSLAVGASIDLSPIMLPNCVVLLAVTNTGAAAAAVIRLMISGG